MTLLLCCVGEVVAQAQKVMSGTVTELIGKTADPLVGVNVNIVNAQNRSLGGSITNFLQYIPIYPYNNFVLLYFHAIATHTAFKK